MTFIGLQRVLAGDGTPLSVGEGMQRNPIHGRQGKSAACGPARMVGWLEFHVPRHDRAGWRFSGGVRRTGTRGFFTTRVAAPPGSSVRIFSPRDDAYSAFLRVR